MQIDCNEKIDILFGSTVVTEIYCDSQISKPSLNDKLYIALDNIKAATYNLMIAVGYIMQIAGLAYIVGIMLRKGLGG